jgi:hypothetical protein
MSYPLSAPNNCDTDIMTPKEAHRRAAKDHRHAQELGVDERSFAAGSVGATTPSLAEETQLTLDLHDNASQYVHQETSNDELLRDNAHGLYQSSEDLADPLSSALNQMVQQDTSVDDHFHKNPQGDRPYDNSDFAYQGHPPVHHHQQSTQGAYQFVTRPWKHSSKNSGHATTSTNTLSPMGRWENESIHEQPWNGVGSVYVVDVRRE